MHVVCDDGRALFEHDLLHANAFEIVHSRSLALFYQIIKLYSQRYFQEKWLCLKPRKPAFIFQNNYIIYWFKHSVCIFCSCYSVNAIEKFV